MALIPSITENEEDCVESQTGVISAQGKSTSSAQVQVRVTNLDKTFHRGKEAVRVLRDVNLEVAEGELLVLLGPSGCGKTTLLRCLVGLERPDGGSIQLGGRAVADSANRVFVQPNRRDVSMVFQNYALWPHMKVAKNVAYPLRARGLKAEFNGDRVDEVLKLVRCDHLADRYPPELSGGQQQRVALARALAPRPALLLLDEPLSNLDALLRIELRAQLRSLHRQLGFTGVYVTHDQEEALAVGTRVAVMRAGQIEQIGAPEHVYRRPATEYVADFLGARNRLDVIVDERGDAVIAKQKLPRLVGPGIAGSFTLRLRDDALRLRPAGSNSGDPRMRWLAGGLVDQVVPGGNSTEHAVLVRGQRLFVGVPTSERQLAPGTEVEVGLDPAQMLCYGADGNVVQEWIRDD